MLTPSKVTVTQRSRKYLLFSISFVLDHGIKESKQFLELNIIGLNSIISLNEQTNVNVIIQMKKSMILLNAKQKLIQCATNVLFSSC
jgi:hypothetical protein